MMHLRVVELDVEFESVDNKFFMVLLVLWNKLRVHCELKKSAHFDY